MTVLNESLDKQAYWTKAENRHHSLVFVLAWLSVWLIGYVVEYVNHASVWFPAAGLTFAALLVIGARIIPALTVGAIISTLWTGYFYDIEVGLSQLFLAGVVFAFAHITPYFVATSLLKRFSTQQFNQFPSLLLLSLVCVMISSLITAFAVLNGLVATGLMESKDVAAAILPFWVGDMAGIIAVGPLFVWVLMKFDSQPSSWQKELKEIAVNNYSNYFPIKLLASGVLLLLILLLAYLVPAQESNLAIFIMILPVMWIALTESPTRTIASVALFSTSVAFFVNLLGLMDFVLVYQFAICIVAASAFLCMTVPALLAHNQALQVQATTDHLTGAASRSHLMNEAHIEITNSQNEDKPLSLIVFDLDNFKNINDTLGHSQGDKVLVEVSRVAGRNIRKSDLLCRLGGDEFVILLPDTKLVEASEVAEKILKQIQMMDLKLGVSFSCSFGTSQLKAGDEFKDLFERADKALYRAKNSGRNQVQICQEHYYSEENLASTFEDHH